MGVEKLPVELVDGGDDGLRGAEVARELLDTVVGVAGGGAGASGDVGVDVGVAELVDRLLRVADHEQAAGLRGVVWAAGDRGDDVELRRVGVLELVDEDDAVLLVQLRAHLVVVYEFLRQVDHVVELEHAGAAAGVGGFAHKRCEHGGDCRRRRVPGVEPKRTESLAEGLVFRSGFLGFRAVAAERAWRRQAELGKRVCCVELGEAVVEKREELVGNARGVGAVANQAQLFAQAGAELVFRWGLEGGRGDGGVELAPVRIHPLSQFLYVLEGHALAQKKLQLGKEFGCGDVGRQGVDSCCGFLVALEQRGDGLNDRLAVLGGGEVGGEVVDGIDLRRKARLERVLLEHAQAEGVQRTERRAGQPLERVRGAGFHQRSVGEGAGLAVTERVLASVADLDERAAQAGGQLRGGGFVEGDGGDLVDAYAILDDEREQALNEHNGLAGAGARLDEAG